jgi:hypothetical protein
VTENGSPGSSTRLAPWGDRHPSGTSPSQRIRPGLRTSRACGRFVHRGTSSGSEILWLNLRVTTRPKLFATRPGARPSRRRIASSLGYGRSLNGGERTAGTAAGTSASAARTCGYERTAPAAKTLSWTTTTRSRCSTPSPCSSDATFTSFASAPARRAESYLSQPAVRLRGERHSVVRDAAGGTGNNGGARARGRRAGRASNRRRRRRPRCCSPAGETGAFKRSTRWRGTR